ncbi:DUF5703 family protein [Kytococcus sp. Marseille-QA3725]
MPIRSLPSAHAKARAAAVWEYRTVEAHRDMSRSELCQLLTELAEYEGWHLHTVRHHQSGKRRVSLRRKVIRQRRPQVVGLSTP